MMLTTFLPSVQQRYAFAGSAVGAVVPIFIFSLESALAGGGVNWTLPFKDITHVFMTLLPVFCGMVFYRIGLTRSLLADQLESAVIAERKLYFEASHDRLTGLANRMALETELQQLIEARKQGRLRPAILLLDVDKFKYINDTLGHDAGDALLVGIARRVTQHMGSFCRLFRLGGDEFVMTVAGVPNDEEIARLCDVISAQLAIPFDLKGSQVTTGASIGITFMDGDDDTMGEVLKRADLALYRAKDSIGTNYIFFTPELGEAAFARRKLERDLAIAVQNDELFLEFQPIVSTITQDVKSFEALVRWRHPHLGVIAPDDFIGEAERNGLIIMIGKWVLENACMHASGWPSEYSVAVNVSIDQFKDRTFPDFVLKTLADNNLPPERLTLEITESIFTVDSVILRETLQTLRVCGVRFSLDDFGSGYSSIAHLRSFPVDSIKIDRSFARSMLENKRDAELVDLIVRLSSAFDAVTVVEGIETDEQLSFVRNLGAAQIQGFLISAPLPPADIKSIISQGGTFRAASPLKIRA